MVSFGVTINLVETTKQIARKILIEFRNQLRKIFPISLPKLQLNARKLVRQAIQRQPEYISLLGGTLQGELGVPESSRRLSVILDTYIDSIVVKLMPIQIRTRTLSGSIVIKFDSQFIEILSLSEAAYLTKKGETIPWLRWLLIEGDLTITEYTFNTVPSHVIDKYSRTGLGLMFKRKGGRWSVPTEFRGTIGNNFITRAIASIQPELDRLARNVLKV